MSEQPISLEAHHLSCIRDDRLLFEGLSFSIGSGEAIVLEGRNGTGKTSLLRILCGLRRPDEGEVRWQGIPIEKNYVDYYTRMAFVGHMDGIKRELSALENLRLSRSLCGSGNVSIEEALETLLLTGYEDIPTYYLSAGQRRRVALARLLATDARLWILDEPFTSLDREGIALVENLMDEHVGAGGAMIMTSHHEVRLSTPGVRVLNLSAREAA
ncbi:MAG: cytochrome c biogenesis heme-transporting ATPase CcmA [Chromatiales bacterium]